MASLFFLLGGNPGVEPVTAISSIGFFLAMILFAWIAVPVITGAKAVSTRRGAHV